MDAIVTKVARQKMIKARAGVADLPKITGFAFGDGGVDDGGHVKTPTEDQTSLNNELLKKVIDDYEISEDGLSCKYTCTLGKTELADEEISEIALYDADNDLVAIKNFLPKGKDDDLEMTFEIDDSMESTLT